MPILWGWKSFTCNHFLASLPVNPTPSDPSWISFFSFLNLKLRAYCHPPNSLQLPFILCLWPQDDISSPNLGPVPRTSLSQQKVQVLHWPARGVRRLSLALDIELEAPGMHIGGHAQQVIGLVAVWLRREGKNGSSDWSHHNHLLNCFPCAKLVVLNPDCTFKVSGEL